MHCFSNFLQTYLHIHSSCRLIITKVIQLIYNFTGREEKKNLLRKSPIYNHDVMKALWLYYLRPVLPYYTVFPFFNAIQKEINFTQSNHDNVSCSESLKRVHQTIIQGACCLQIGCKQHAAATSKINRVFKSPVCLCFFVIKLHHFTESV